MDDPPEPHGRRRKGSLRKTVLLGVERLRGDRRSSLSTVTNAPKTPTKSTAEARSSPKHFTFELPNSSTESQTSDNAPRHSTSDNADEHDAIVEASTHDIISPTSTHTSGVSDEDVLTFPSTSSSKTVGTAVLDGQTLRAQSLVPPSVKSVSPSPSPPSSESSGPASFSNTNESAQSMRRRRSTLRPSATSKASPLSSIPSIQTLPPIEEEWDYGDTEWWGWIILTVTWIVFVVGMGSCLGVWKWAWDVGETPYAPPELEDDPTLPIDGYYPALLVLTAVMSWVWVVVAWVGLKYFRHAKMGVVEDG